MPDSYDKYGNVIRHQYGLDPNLYHRFEAGVGDECKTCGNDRFAIAHFNGDKTAAQLARENHHRTRQSLKAWRENLRVGDRVQITENHPREDLRGRTGTVTAFTSGTNPLVKDRIVSIKMVKIGNRAPVELAIPAHFLAEPQMQVRVPKFDSPDEADKWLEDRAKEMGIVSERDTPFFATQQEADEWLAQQERIANKEPWLPPSWRDDNIQAQAQAAAVRRDTSERWWMLNPVLAAGEMGVETDNAPAIKVGDGVTPWNELPYTDAKAWTHPQSGNQVFQMRGMAPQQVIVDEAGQWQALGD